MLRKAVSTAETCQYIIQEENTGYSYSGHLLCESFGEVKHYTFLLTGAGCLNSALNINVSLQAKNF